MVFAPLFEDRLMKKGWILFSIISVMFLSGMAIALFKASTEEEQVRKSACLKLPGKVMWFRGECWATSGTSGRCRRVINGECMMETEVLP